MHKKYEEIHETASSYISLVLGGGGGGGGLGGGRGLSQGITQFWKIGV